MKTAKKYQVRIVETGDVLGEFENPHVAQEYLEEEESKNDDIACEIVYVPEEGELENYLKSCLAFAEAAKYLDIFNFQFYSSTPNGDWYESSDNAEGGIDVSWSLAKNEENIKRDYKYFFQKGIGCRVDF